MPKKNIYSEDLECDDYNILEPSHLFLNRGIGTHSKNEDGQ